MSIRSFKAARDFLFTHREDYATAYRDFRWPELEHFNYALDWFDAELGRVHGNELALKIVTPREQGAILLGEIDRQPGKAMPERAAGDTRAGQNIRLDEIIKNVRDFEAVGLDHVCHGDLL